MSDSTEPLPVFEFYLDEFVAAQLDALAMLSDAVGLHDVELKAQIAVVGWNLAQAFKTLWTVVGPYLATLDEEPMHEFLIAQVRPDADFSKAPDPWGDLPS